MSTEFAPTSKFQAVRHQRNDEAPDVAAHQTISRVPGECFRQSIGGPSIVSLQSIAVGNSIQQFNWAIGGSGALLGFCLDMIAPFPVRLLLE